MPNGTYVKTELREEAGSLGSQLTVSRSVRRAPIRMRVT